GGGLPFQPRYYSGKISGWAAGPKNPLPKKFGLGEKKRGKRKGLKFSLTGNSKNTKKPLGGFKKKFYKTEAIFPV
ncbi:hypothetical protein ACNITC_28075, partial [Escherichia coli]